MMNVLQEALDLLGTISHKMVGGRKSKPDNEKEVGTPRERSLLVGYWSQEVGLNHRMVKVGNRGVKAPQMQTYYVD